MIERFAQMPSALRAAARWERLGGARQAIPALLVHPDWGGGEPAPVVVWMHGRTANKELDPGRYLRWMRAGIGACAVDLPGHGERFDQAMQQAQNTLQVVQQMIDEIDAIVAALTALGSFDMKRVGIGGVSAGAMAAMARLGRPHHFRCASVEASSGSWEHQLHREMFQGKNLDEINRTNPMTNLDGWREMPFQAFHAQRDEWVSIEGQRAFVEALRSRYRDPSIVELIEYEQTDAPHEHIGFGKMARDAKDRQRDFFKRWLIDSDSPGSRTG